MSEGLARSVQTRLVAHAKSLGVDPNLILSRFATERLLYRLSCSRHAERFVLKGALLLIAWFGETVRPTRDVDLLGSGEVGPVALHAMLSEISTLAVEPDGLTFDPSSIRVAPIRPENAYGGQRITLIGLLGPARLRVQVDVGIGDAVSPEPAWLAFPSLLELPRPRLRAYQPETMIAEKLHAMVELGSKNSRMRDFFDVQLLTTNRAFEGHVLLKAIEVTFARRETVIPQTLPVALTPVFVETPGKAAQWDGFLRRLPTTVVSGDLPTILDQLAGFVGPVLRASARGEDFQARWLPGGPWVRRRSE